MLSDTNYDILYFNIVSFIKIVLLISSYIFYIVLTIIALYNTSYNEQINECNNSNLWINVLLNLLSNISLLILIKSKNVLYNSIILIINFSFLIWSMWIFNNNNCIDNLKNTLLYTVIQLNIILGIIFIMSLMFYVLCKFYS